MNISICWRSVAMAPAERSAPERSYFSGVARASSAIASAARRSRFDCVSRAMRKRLSTSTIQSRASRIQRSSRSAMTGAADCGSTIDETRLAQTIPSVISSTRQTAVSNIAPGSPTAGKPISAAV